MQGQKKVELKLHCLFLKVKHLKQNLRKEKEEKRVLKMSRNKWKEKSKNHLKALRKIERQTKKRRIRGADRPKNHSYTSADISFTLQIRKNGKCSLRSTVKILKMLVLCLGLELRIPSHESISLWEQQ